MKISLVLSTHAASFEPLVYQGDLEHSVAKIASLGYDGVELAVQDPNLLDVEDLRWLMADHGLEVPAIGTGQAYGEQALSLAAWRSTATTSGSRYLAAVGASVPTAAIPTPLSSATPRVATGTCHSNSSWSVASTLTLRR